jgi:hypothetical protein
LAGAMAFGPKLVESGTDVQHINRILINYFYI